MNQQKCNVEECQPERMTQVLEALANLQYIASDMWTVIKELEEKLSAVLLPKNDKIADGKPTAEPCNLVPLADEMRSIFFTSRRCKDRVIDIIQRLEL